MKERKKNIWLRTLCVVMAVCIVMGMTMSVASAATMSKEYAVDGKKHALYKSDGSVSSYQPSEINCWLIDGQAAYCVECGVKITTSNVTPYEQLSEACANGDLHTAAGGGGIVSRSSAKAEKWIAYTTYVNTSLPREDIAMGVWQALGSAFPVSGSYAGYDRYMSVWNAFSSWYSSEDASYYGCSSATLYYSPGSETQIVCRFVPYELPKKGWIGIRKASSDAGFVSGNDSYSLEGAVYTIFDSKGSAEGTITTDKSGEGRSGDLSEGNYTVKETKAPKGYEADKSVYTVSVKSGETSDLSVTDVPKKGSLSIEKYSSNKGITDDNSCYSLEGAEFSVKGKWNGKEYGTVKTDSSGKAVLSGIPLGSYMVKEVTASSGYALNPNEFSAEITETTPSLSYRVSVSETPKNDPVSVLLSKKDADTGEPVPTGDGTLEGAEFTVRYYDGLYGSRSELPGSAERTWVFRTDKNGRASFTKGYKVAGDELYYSSSGMETMPVGTVTVEETEAPEGYVVDSDFFSIQQITGPGSGERIDVWNAPVVSDRAIKGKLEIIKVLNENVQQTGSERITTINPEKGAEFEVYLSSAGSYAAARELERDYLVTGENGKAVTKDLPYGKYTVHQVKGSEAYQLHEDAEMVIESDGQTVSVILDNKKEYMYVRIRKTDSETGRVVPLAGTVFRIKDAEGNYVVQKVRLPGGEITFDSFETDDEGVALVPFALEYGKYRVCEIKAPEKYHLASTEKEFTVSYASADRDSSDTVTVDFADEPWKGKIVISKTGKYTVYEKNVFGQYVTVEKTEKQGDAVFEITAAEDIVVGGDVRAEKDTVVDRMVTDAEGIAESCDLYPGRYSVRETEAPEGFEISDEIYTVEITEENAKAEIIKEYLDVENKGIVREIGTKAGAEDGSGSIICGRNVVIKDTVKLSGLIPGREYTLEGFLREKESGEKIEGSDSAVTFTAEESGCGMELDFVMDTRKYAGKDIVVCELLFEGETCVCVHDDTGDADQTVTVKTPEIHTKATVGGSKTATPKAGMKLTDTVSFSNIQPGIIYRLKGVLVDKYTGMKILSGGVPVEAEKLMVSVKPDGVTEMEFLFDASALAGRSVVVYEELYDGDLLIASHRDITDSDQTVEFVSAVKTGDDTDIGKYALVMVCAGCAAAVACILLKKKKASVKE